MTGALPPSSRWVRFTTRCGGFEHLLAGADVAGQRDHVDVRVGDQGVADAGAAAGDDVGDAGGEFLGEDRAELQRGQRRHLGGLEDDGVAGPDRWGELPGHHHQRVVPGRDRGDDADRIAADHRGVAGEVLAGKRPRSGSARRRRRSASSRRSRGSRRSASALIGLPQFSASRAEKASASASMRSAIRWRAAERSAGVVRDHAVEGVAGGGDGGADLGLGGLGHLGDGGAGARVQDRFRRVLARREGASDKHRRLHPISSCSGACPQWKYA